MATAKTTTPPASGTKKQLSTSALQSALSKTKANKKSNAPATSDGSTTDSTPPGEKRTRLTDEQRAERDQAKALERAEKRAARETEREERRAARELEKSNKTAHMAKVDRAGQNLPQLSKTATTHVEDIMSNLSETDITGIISHLTHQLRARATASALKVNLTEGQLVRIVSADVNNSKYIGMLAHVLTDQRIRCYVQPVGTEKEVYLFKSNVKPLSEDEIKAVKEASSRPSMAPASKVG